MTNLYDKERSLYRDVTSRVERSLPGVEVLALELSGPERMTIYVDHPNGVDHELCERVTEVLRDYLADYAIDVSSPGTEPPLRRRPHFERVVGRTVSVRTDGPKARPRAGRSCRRANAARRDRQRSTPLRSRTTRSCEAT